MSEADPERIPKIADLSEVAFDVVIDFQKLFVYAGNAFRWLENGLVRLRIKHAFSIIRFLLH